MTVSATLYPEEPVTARTTRVAFATTEVGANYVQLVLTNAPLGSALLTKLEESEQSELEVFAGDSDGAAWEYAFDVGGTYVFTAREIQKGATTHGGSYLHSTDGNQTETIKATNSLTINVGSRLEADIGVRPDTGTLVLYVFADTIKATTFSTHGVKTPAIIDPETPAARIAATSSTVTAALTALGGGTATDALGTLATPIGDLITNFDAHLTQASVHNANDTDNGIDAAFGSPTGIAGYAATLNEIRKKFLFHITNDASIGEALFGPGTASYHTTADFGSTPIAPPASEDDPLSVITLLADLWRAYEAHRVSDVHDADDSTNTLDALAELPALYSKFLTILAAESPTAPATSNSGAVLLVQSAGFTEV